MLLILLGAILSALPVYFVLKYNDSKNILFLILGMIFNALLVIVYSKVLTNKNGTGIYTIIKMVSIIMVGVTCYLFFNEKFATKKIIGLILAMTSIFLIA